MGEAKRRRDLLKSIVITDDLKDDIARAVRSINFDIRLGVCGWRALTGTRLLNHHLGLPATVTAGGMIYRAGPDPYRDVVAFVGPGNLGCFRNDFGIIGHVWISLGDQIIDFTPGDWPDLKCGDMGSTPEDIALGEIQWEARPPEFFWRNRSEVIGREYLIDEKEMKREGWLERYTPTLGKVWYTGWRGERPSITDNDLPWAMIDQHFENHCRSFMLKERLAGYCVNLLGA